jgi:hypothetical protein
VRTYLLQDWTTLTGNSSVTSVKQSDEGWLELVGARDLLFYVDVAEATAAVGPIVYVESSPTPDDELFSELTHVTTSSTGVQMAAALARNAPLQPLCKFVRWSVGVTTPGTWSLTFRAYACINFIRPDFAVFQNGMPIGALP